MKPTIILAILASGIFLSCTNDKANKEHQSSLLETQNTSGSLTSQINGLNQILIDAAITQDFGKAKLVYAEDALLLTDFNPIIDGRAHITQFYTALFGIKQIKTYTKTTTEIIDLGERILEIGIFDKSFKNQEPQKGKYFNVWQPQPDGSLQLTSESFGYSHEIPDQSALVVEALKNNTSIKTSRNIKAIPEEIKTYYRLTEEHSKERNPDKAMKLFTQDATYYRFAKKEVHGFDVITKYYTDYYSNPVTIDSIKVKPYHYHKVKDGYLSYTQFYVEWTVPDFSGITQGTGLVYLKKDNNGFLQRHRLIGFRLPQNH